MTEPALADAIRRYADEGVVLPHDLSARAERRVAPFVLADVNAGRSAERLVGAWRAINPARSDEDEIWLVLLRAFKTAFSGFTPGLQPALKAHRMGVTRTRIQVDLQLASRCFHLGRRLITRDADSPPGRFLLDECVEMLSCVARIENRLPGHTRRMYRGQLATSLTILSRRSPTDEVVERLLLAEEHSCLAEELGDRTDQHFAYRAEIALRLHDATRDPAHLDRARGFLASVTDVRTKRLRAAIADVDAERGYACFRSREVAEGVALLLDAERGYGEALALVEADGVHDGYLSAKRGQLRNLLYREAVDPHGRRDSRLLDAALADWLDPQASTHVHEPTVATALLDRARIRARRNDLAGADADRERARAMVRSGSTTRVDTKLRAAELEHSITEAIAAADTARVQQLVDEVTAIPPDEVVPSAALARACKVLGVIADRDDWIPVATRALDRLELELGHPSVSAPAARAIAGHAALLSWLLARRTDDREQLARTVQLYRTSFGSVAFPPSVDALANAGACALALGKHLLRGDETDAEEAAGLFVDGVSWLGSALERASRMPAAARDDFDPVMAHSRLGEAALRAYPLTGTEDMLDTAVEHLGLARDLGQNAVELTGLLGDAHYRRGTRWHDSSDLERSISLKDNAFAAGAHHRENRSVTAAAAVRLFGLTNEPGLLTDAAARALEAALLDPSWPWAVIQLADLAARSSLLDDGCLAEAEPRELATWVLTGRRNELMRRAAELAVGTEEFSGSILGGQQRSGERGVRVLNDPHRLIEQTLILKRLGHDEAHRERDATVRFGQWLATAAAPATWSLPEPLAVVDLPGGDSVYVMRRSQGRTLGATVVEWHNAAGPDPRPRFREAMRFLAAFQSWRAGRDDRFARICGAPERAAFQAQLTKAARKLDLDERTRDLLDAVCGPFLADGMPAVAKKDPHPGNWLWTRRNELVLLDIEATVALPLLLEVVAIIDDLPLLDLTAQGWVERQELCRDYVGALREFGFPALVEDFPIAECYEAMATLHAAKGLGRIRGADPGVSSFSLGARRLQQAHYRGLLTYLRESATHPEVRRSAGAILATQ